MSQVIIQMQLNENIKRYAKMILDGTLNEEGIAHVYKRLTLQFYEYYNFYNPDSCCYNHAFPSEEKKLAEINDRGLYDKYEDQIKKAIQHFLDNPEKLEPPKEQ